MNLKNTLAMATSLATMILLIIMAFATYTTIQSPKAFIAITDKSLSNKNNDDLYNIIDINSLKKNLGTEISLAIEKKLFTEISGTCIEIDKLLSSFLRADYIENLTNRTNLIKTILSHKYTEPDYMASAAKIDSDGSYDYHDFDSLSRIITIDGRRITITYSRTGILDWKITDIDGLDFDRLSEDLISEEGALLFEIDKICSRNNKVGHTESEKTKEKTKKPQHKTKSIPKTVIMNPLTKACDIQKKLIRQGFMIDPISCKQ